MCDISILYPHDLFIPSYYHWIKSDFFQGILAGELKHGPLALIDAKMPIILVMNKDRHYCDTESAFKQVTARSGDPIVICDVDDDTPLFKGIIQTHHFLTLITFTMTLKLSPFKPSTLLPPTLNLYLLPLFLQPLTFTFYPFTSNP